MDGLEPKRQPRPSYQRKYPLLDLENGLDPFFTDLLKNAFPICSWLRDTLMRPQSVNFDHGRTFLGFFEKHTVGQLKSFQFRIGLKAKSFPQDFRNDENDSVID